MGTEHDKAAAEDALGKGEVSFRSLLQHVLDIVAVLDADGTLRYVSPAAEAVLGYAPEEVVGTSIFDYVHPDDLSRASAALAETLVAPGGLPPLEFRARRADGAWRHVEVVRNNRLDDPAVGGVVINVRDITERKAGEEELDALRREYEELVGSVEAIIWKGEAQTLRFTFVSDQAEAILGYPVQRWTQEPSFWPDHIHQEDREWAVSLCRKAVEKKEDHDFEYRMITAEGEVVWLRDIVRVGVENGVPTQLFGVMVDVTERKETEKTVEQLGHRNQLILDSAGEGIYGLDREGTTTFVNPAAAALTGYDSEDLVGKDQHELIHHSRPDGTPYPKEACPIHAAIWDGEARRVDEDVFWRKDGMSFPVEYTSNPILEDGELVGTVVTFTDITERKEAEARLRATEERYRTVVEEQTELVCRFLPDLTLTFVNGAYCRYFGQEPEELIGESFLGHIPEEDHARYVEELSELNPDNPTRTVEHRVFDAEGEVCWQQWTDTAIFDAEGRPVEYQSVGRDVTERRALEERLEHQALHDSITDLPNRRLFVDRLGQAIRRIRRRKGRRVAVLFMDLDGFKVVNDSLGHDTGDRLLVEVAERLKGCLRPEDTFARFGGDEFTVMVEDVQVPDDAVRVAERIMEELREPFTLDGRELYVAASIGVGLGSDDTKNAEELLREADTSMYKAKEEGGTFKLFDPAMHERALGRLELENDLRRAIEENEFVVHYQPIVNLQTGELWGFEALVRWEHPERGLLDPDEFVPVAEESGLVVPVGELVLKEACRRAVEWQRECPLTPPLAMTVNLSGRQLRRPDLHEVIGRVLAETGLAASSLGLDITETVYIGVLDANTAALDRLRALGIRISLDDFGSGYSSLSYLKRLPTDILKVDRSFTKGLGLEVEDTAIVQTVVDLAHILGMEVVAEGVEIEEQETLLKEMGCDFGQGYHFSKPLPPEEASELLGSAFRDLSQRDGSDSLSDSD